MVNNNRIPMRVPAIGQAQQQPPFDVTQAVRKTCESCNGELFDKAFRVGAVSKLALGNTTNQDITVEYPVYVCRACGWELGALRGVKQ